MPVATKITAPIRHATVDVSSVSAGNLERFGRALRPLPFIIVPAVHRGLSSDRVLTMSLVAGRHLDEWLERRPSQAAAARCLAAARGPGWRRSPRRSQRFGTTPAPSDPSCRGRRASGAPRGRAAARWRSPPPPSLVRRHDHAMLGFAALTASLRTPRPRRLVVTEGNPSSYCSVSFSAFGSGSTEMPSSSSSCVSSRVAWPRMPRSSLSP